MRTSNVFMCGGMALATACLLLLTASGKGAAGEQPDDTTQLDQRLSSTLKTHGFTGTIAASLEKRLGRKIDPRLANLGRLLWFDTLGGLNNDNTCGGCHSPTNGFGDTQSIAIGIDSNGIVGPHRAGPRNQRRTPMAANAAFFPNLMWNSRFAALSGDPFDNRAGFRFPQPEGLLLSSQPHLLAAQAYIPPTERTEAAGFTFDFPDALGAAHEHTAIRGEVIRRINGIPEYRRQFATVFAEVASGRSITFAMFGRAIAEFEFTLVLANAPIDQFARGETSALSHSQKRGALLFFGKAGCVGCHEVSGQSNEMFSDFRLHNIGVPQIVPSFSNVVFDGPGANEDFGLEQVSGDPADRYLFRTSPLRNVALQPAFFHNGSFTRLEEAIRHHLDVFRSARGYTPPADLAGDLLAPLGPIEPVLAKLDPLVSAPLTLTEAEFDQLADFVRNGLLDEAARPQQLKKRLPVSVPSGRPLLKYEFADH